MERPKIRYPELSATDALDTYPDDLNKYIDYLELRVGALTNGLNDIVITLKNMQRDGKEDK